MPKYKRVLLKLSGEVLGEVFTDDRNNEHHVGIDFRTVHDFAVKLAEIREAGIELSLVIGGGNMMRGRNAGAMGLDHVSLDGIGMLGTVMNALAVKTALEKLNVPAKVLSAIGMPPVAELYNRERAKKFLSEGNIVLFGAGTGHPFFSTDTAAALRASELGLDCVIKGTKVDGIYDKDPNEFKDAKLFPKLTYDEAISRNLKVMDTAAFALCRENKMPVWVISINDSEWVKNIIEGRNVGTIVKED
ncbi:MAG: UMP kinase [Synergistaceae bacterium]|nr:UMP kinase [Synergistaceae bacterium]